MPNRDHDSRERDPRDRDAQLERDGQGPMRARLGGETVEPRILLSATWLVDIITTPPPDILGVTGTDGADRLVGTIGEDSMYGGGGDDVLVVQDNDDGDDDDDDRSVLDGGTGRDVVDFGASAAGTTIDLSAGTAIGGGGSTTLTNIEGAYGSSHADVFAFASAAAGDEFTVVGNGGQDFLDLQKYDSSAATFENGALVIDLGGGESFRINYDEVERIQFGDVLAKVLTGDHVNTSFTGDGLYVFEDTAFALSFTGGGDLDWRFDATTDTITVNGSAGATAGTELVIDDLGRSPITVSTITLSENLRAISSSADVDNLDLNGFDVDTVTVGNGTGTIGTLVTPTIDSDLSVNANVTTVTIAGDIDRAVTIGGNVGSIDAQTINGPLAISGDAGTLTADTINGDVTIKGDLGSATVTTFQTSATLRVDNPTGIVNLTFGGSDRSFDTGDEPFVYRAAVDAFNLVPIALAGSDQVVQEGDAVGLDGRGSTDPKTTGLTYRWTQVSGPAVTLIDGDTATPRFTAPEGLVNTTIEFELQVDDGEDVAVDRVVVTVQADNDAPIANAGTDRIVAEGNATALDGRGSVDPEAQGLTYSWRQISGPPVTLVNPTAAVTGFVAPEGLANSVAQFELTVSDGASASVDTVSVIMLADNDAPTANAGADQTVDEGDTIVLDGSGSTDPENGTLSYAWQQVSGPPVQIVAADQPLAQTDADGSSFTTFTRTADGRVHFIAPEGLSNTTATFRLIVDDGTTRSIDTVTITIRADDDAPTVDAGPNRQITAGEVVKLAADGRDPENQPLSYRWVQLSGPTVTLSDPTAESPTFQVPTGHTGEMVVFGVQASDGTSTSFDTVAMRIENSPPVVVAGSAGNAESGESVGLSAFAQDVDGDDLTYRWTQVGGPSVNLAGTDLPNATFQAPRGLGHDAAALPDRGQRRPDDDGPVRHRRGRTRIGGELQDAGRPGRDARRRGVAGRTRTRTRSGGGLERQRRDDRERRLAANDGHDHDRLDHDERTGRRRPGGRCPRPVRQRSPRVAVRRRRRRRRRAAFRRRRPRERRPDGERCHGRRRSGCERHRRCRRPDAGGRRTDPRARGLRGGARVVLPRPGHRGTDAGDLDAALGHGGRLRERGRAAQDPAAGVVHRRGAGLRGRDDDRRRDPRAGDHRRGAAGRRGAAHQRDAEVAGAPTRGPRQPDRQRVARRRQALGRARRVHERRAHPTAEELRCRHGRSMTTSGKPRTRG